MIQLKDIYSICIDKKFPLAVYQYPGDNQFQYIIQLSNLKKLNDGEDITSMKGFAFVPFNQPYPLPSYVIEPDIMNRDRSYDSSILQLLNQSKALTPDAYVSDIPYMASQEEYSDHVTEIITHIKNGKFQKAILSRTLIEKRPDFLNHTDLFLKMCKR